jgi:RNA polymerase-binding protein DksA
MYRSTHSDLREETARAEGVPLEQNEAPRDEGDDALRAQLDELRHSMEERHALLAQAMEAALGRMRDGSYGACTRCGREIELERLKVVPWATLCIEDQEALEQERQEHPPTL